MKKEWWFLGALALCCIALALAGQNGQGGADFIFVLAAPFVWAGAGLRALSLSGWLGNLLAILLYALASLLPVVPIFVKCLRPKGWLSKILLAVMSAYLFFLLYFMVNPFMIKTLFFAAAGAAQELLAVEQVTLCMYLYDLLIVYWILGVMADKARLTLQLRRLVVVLGAVLVISVCYVNLAGLKNVLASLPAQSSADALLQDAGLPLSGEAAASPNLDGMMAVLLFASDNVPALLLLMVLPVARKLLASLDQSFFSEENQRHAALLAKRCRLVLFVSLGGTLVTNGLQLLLASRLANVQISGQMPLAILVLSLAMMLLGRYLERSCAVYRENEMMI